MKTTLFVVALILGALSSSASGAETGDVATPENNAPAPAPVPAPLLSGTPVLLPGRRLGVAGSLRVFAPTGEAWSLEADGQRWLLRRRGEDAEYGGYCDGDVAVVTSETPAWVAGALRYAARWQLGEDARCVELLDPRDPAGRYTLHAGWDGTWWVATYGEPLIEGRVWGEAPSWVRVGFDALTGETGSVEFSNLCVAARRWLHWVRGIAAHSPSDPSATASVAFGEELLVHMDEVSAALRAHAEYQGNDRPLIDSDDWPVVLEAMMWTRRVHIIDQMSIRSAVRQYVDALAMGGITRPRAAY